MRLPSRVLHVVFYDHENSFFTALMTLVFRLAGNNNISDPDYFMPPASVAAGLIGWAESHVVR